MLPAACTAQPTKVELALDDGHPGLNDLGLATQQAALHTGAERAAHSGQLSPAAGSCCVEKQCRNLPPGMRSQRASNASREQAVRHKLSFPASQGEACGRGQAQQFECFPLLSKHPANCCCCLSPALAPTCSIASSKSSKSSDSCLRCRGEPMAGASRCRIRNPVRPAMPLAVDASQTNGNASRVARLLTRPKTSAKCFLLATGPSQQASRPSSQLASKPGRA